MPRSERKAILFRMRNGAKNVTLDQYLAAESISTREFAGLVGCAPSTISRIRRGRQDPSLSLAQRIVAASRKRLKLPDLVKGNGA